MQDDTTKEMRMAALTGTETQIAKAEKIRARIIAEWETHIEENRQTIARLQSEGRPTARSENALSIRQANLQQMLSITDAGFWIGEEIHSAQQASENAARFCNK